MKIIQAIYEAVKSFTDELEFEDYILALLLVIAFLFSDFSPIWK